MTFQLVYWGTYTQIHLKINLPVYLHASLSSNHKGLPVTTTTCVHAHRCTHSWPHVFIFRLSCRLTIKIHPFTVLLFDMSTDVPVHQYTCSVCFFFFSITCTMTFQLIYWGTYTQIHLKTYLPIYLHAFFFFFNLTTKTYLSPQLLVYMHIDAAVHDPTCSCSYCHSD